MESEYPVQVEIPAPEKSSRWLALATLLFFIPKLILLIPQIFIMYFVAIAAMCVAFAGQIVVLFTGKYPRELHEFVAGFIRWQVRVNSYALGLTDAYPPFRLKK